MSQLPPFDAVERESQHDEEDEDGEHKHRNEEEDTDSDHWQGEVHLERWETRVTARHTTFPLVF